MPTATPNALPVFVNVQWAGRTRNVGVDASRVSSAQSAVLRFYTEGLKTATPSATVTVNRDTNRRVSYSEAVQVGAGKVDANRLLLVEGTFHAEPNGAGASVGTVSFSSTVDKTTGEINNSIAVSSVIRSVVVSVPAVKVGQTAEVSVSARDATGSAVAVSPGSVSLAIANAAKDVDTILEPVTGAGAEPIRVRGVRVGTTSLTATVDGVSSPTLAVTVVP